MKTKTMKITGLLLTLVMLVTTLGSFGMTAFAADGAATTETRTIMLGTSHITGGQASNIYFGTYQQSSLGTTQPTDGTNGVDWIKSDTAINKDQGPYYKIEPIKWRVLSNADGKAFLLSDQNLDVVKYLEYHSYTENVTWEKSTIRSWLNGYGASSNIGGAADSGIDYTNENFLDTAFSASEQLVIADTTVVNDDNLWGIPGGNDTTDKVFLLSYAEAMNAAYGFLNEIYSTHTRLAVNTAYVYGGGKNGTSSNIKGVGIANSWRLRSPGSYAYCAAYVGSDGDMVPSGNEVYSNNSVVRPAFNLNLSSVLFTSAAVGGKPTGTGLTATTAYTGKEYKLTLLDSNRNFAVSDTSAKTVKPGDTLSLGYTGATTGTNEYISAMIVGESGAVVYYGQLAQAAQASGTVSLTVPAGIAEGKYTLKLFNEQLNGDKKTDYSSDFVNVSLTVCNHTGNTNMDYEAVPETNTHSTTCSVCGETFTVAHNGTVSYTPNANDSTKHDVSYSCCEGSYSVTHTMNSATGKCDDCGLDMADASMTTAGDTPVVTYYATLEAAITAAQRATGSTVKLLDSVTLSNAIEITAGQFTIDLNGKTLTSASEDDAFVIEKDVTAYVTITSTVSGGKIEADNYCVLADKGGTAKVTNVALHSNGTYAAGALSENAVLTLENVTITTDNCGVYAGSSTKVEILGDSSVNAIRDLFDIFCTTDATMTVGAGVTFPNGLTTGSSSEAKPLKEILADGMAYWTGENQMVQLDADTYQITGTVTVKAVCTHEGEEFTYTANADGATHTKKYKCCGTVASANEEHNGTVSYTPNANDSTKHDVSYSCCDGSYSVTHTMNPATGKCDDCGLDMADAIVTTAGDTPVVTYYATLAEAITAAKSATGSTVKLLDSVTLSNAIQISEGQFTIDLNGKTVTSEVEDAAFGIIDTAANVTITSAVSGGKIEAKAYCVFASDGGTAKVTNVALHSNTGTYTAGAMRANAVLTLKNVTITTDNRGVYAGYGGKVEILGTSSVKANQYDIDCDIYSVLTVGAGVTFPNGLTTESSIYAKPLKDILANGMAYWTGENQMVQDADTYQIAGTVTVRAACAHSDASKFTYTADGATITATCTSCNNTAGNVTITVVSTDLTYDGKKKELKAENTIPGVEAPAITCATDLTSAGTHTATITLGGKTATLNVTIGKVTLKASDFTYTEPTDLVYNGTKKEASVTTSLVGVGTVTIKYYKDGEEVASPTYAGTYTVKIDVAESANNNAVTLEVGTFEIEKATPTLTVKSPMTSVLPGNTILLTVTANDSEVNNFTINAGTLYTVNGMKITVFDDAVIGQDKITVTVTSAATTNYNEATATITLDVGMADFSSEIAELKEKLAALEDKYHPTADEIDKIKSDIKALEGADSEFNSKLAEMVSDISRKLSDLENVYATKKELKDAVDDLKERINSNDTDISSINNTIVEINNKIATLASLDYVDNEIKWLADLIANLTDRVTTNEGNIKINADEIASLKESLGILKTILETKDAELAADIAALVNALDNLEERVTANETAIAELKAATETLNNAMQERDADLSNEIKALNDALTNANAALEATDAANKTELEGKITDAQNALKAAIDNVQTNLDNAKADLERAILELETATLEREADLSDEINKLITALASAQAALEQADDDNKAELVKKIEDADAALNAAINVVQNNLDDAKAELEKAIADGDTALDEKITNLNAALESAKATLEQADADNKSELVSKIETADATLSAAIEQVQKNLDDAKAELDNAIADLDAAMQQGDADLSDEIASLNDALASAKATLEHADVYNKEELVKKIDDADATLSAAIEQVQQNLDDAKAELDDADATLSAAIEQVQQNLDDAKAELEKAIADGDAELDDKITALYYALAYTKAILEQADIDNKEELVKKIDDADAALDAAIKAVQKNLDDAKAELDTAIKNGDTALDEKITNLNAALESAKAALEATDAANKTELEGKIETADATLDAAIKAVQKNLDDAKNELQNAINANETDIEDKVAKLNAALESAKTALDATVTATKTELEGKITDAQNALQAAIDNVQTNLDNAKSELEKAIADLDAAMKQGDADLSDEIANLNAALASAKAALEKADADNKAELVSKIETADATLDAAIKAVQKNLSDAKAELDKAIADGDAELDAKITALNKALAAAKAALETADTVNKSELTTKIDEAYSSLDSAVKAVQKNLDDLKAALEAKDIELANKDVELENKDIELANKDAELENKDSELQTFIIIVCVISGVAFCGCGTLAVFYFMDKRKSSKK